MTEKFLSKDKKELQSQATELFKKTHEFDIDLENLPAPRTRGQRNLTEKQRKFAVLWASRAWHGMSMTEMCKLAGFSLTAGYIAKKKPEFHSYVEDILDRQNRDFMSQVYKELQNIIKNSRSEKNKLDAIKIWLQMNDKLTHKHEIEVSQKPEPPKLEELEREVLELERELQLDEKGNEYEVYTINEEHEPL